MRRQEAHTWRLLARLGGAALMILGLTGAEGGLPFSLEGVLYAIGAGLVVWGTTKAKIDRMELELEKKVNLDVYTQAFERLDRLEDKLDRLLERP